MRMKRDEIGLSQRELGNRAESKEEKTKAISDRHISTIEKMAEPNIHAVTRRGIAHALGMTVQSLDVAWKSTPVMVPDDALVAGSDAAIDKTQAGEPAKPIEEIVRLAEQLKLSPSDVIKRFRKIKGLHTAADVAKVPRQAASQSEAARRAFDQKSRKREE